MRYRCYDSCQKSRMFVRWQNQPFNQKRYNRNGYNGMRKELKIYFAGSIRGGRDDQALYADLIEYLRSFGTVLTEHVGDSKLTERGEAGEQRTDMYIYERDVAWIRESDVVVAEVTTPSLGVGYEIGLAESLGKQVFALFRPSSGRHLSAMIGGNRSVVQIEYETLHDLQELLGPHLQAL